MSRLVMRRFLPALVVSSLAVLSIAGFAAAGCSGVPPLPPENAKRVTPDDIDGDGIKNSLDRCPEVPEDEDGIMDGDGCPEKDADGDGVPDVCDRCPLERGVNSADHPWGRGCPVVIDTESFYYLRQSPILFQTNDAKLTAKQSSAISIIAAKIRSEPPDLRFYIIGNSTADEAPAVALQRATVVRDSLVTMGLPPEQLEIHSADSSHPLLQPGGNGLDTDASRRVDIEPSRVAKRDRVWNSKLKSVEYVVLPDLPCDVPFRHADKTEVTPDSAKPETSASAPPAKTDALPPLDGPPPGRPPR